jgi:hypothetical protein
MGIFCAVGRALTLPLALWAAAASSCEACPGGCPAAGDHILLEVTSSPEMPASGVQATLIGSTTIAMSCRPTGAVTVCWWPTGSAVKAGTYSLQVDAPGYQSVNAQAELSLSTTCGCVYPSMEPSIVPITPDVL